MTIRIRITIALTSRQAIQPEPATTPNIHNDKNNNNDENDHDNSNNHHHNKQASHQACFLTPLSLSP